MSYVVMIGATGAKEAQVEAILKVAGSFLLASDTFTRRERGRFRRMGRKQDADDGTLRLVQFDVQERVGWAQAKVLEDVLRSAMKSARIEGEVHVLLADDEVRAAVP